MPIPLSSNDTIWSVSALNFEIKTMLEKGIGSIWIEGEISNFARPASGHWYFSLKDERAQLRAAMFKNRNGRVAFTPENGQQVLIRAQVTLYEARGDFQVIVEHMEEAGVGRLMREYEALKKQLAGEGLFESSNKKTIPTQARHIGIITSSSGAAIRDALSVIRRRSPTSEVTVYPTPVQGETASRQIVAAIERANQHHQCDVLLLIRGGGSLEDLWSFNEEIVARAIFASDIPIVSGVGHEIDFTIADFVADLRAPTPSVAAETVTMDQYELMTQLDQISARLVAQFQRQLATRLERFTQLQSRLMSFHPQRQMASLRQRLDFACSRLNLLKTMRLEQARTRLHATLGRFQLLKPTLKIEQLKQQTSNLDHLLQSVMLTRLQTSQHQLGLLATTLDNLSPLKTLARGYAAIEKDHQVISSVRQLQSDDEIGIRLKDGTTRARVISTHFSEESGQ